MGKAHGQVRLRLARAGQTHRPFYRIVAMPLRKPRDAKPLENLGTYDPLPDKYGQKHIALNVKRIEHYIMYGATPSETVQKILSWAQVLPPYPRKMLPGEHAATASADYGGGADVDAGEPGLPELGLGSGSVVMAREITGDDADGSVGDVPETR